MDTSEYVKTYEPQEYGTTFGAADADYVTLTTFHQGTFYDVYNLLTESGAESVADTFRGYEGVRIGQVRMLEGEQKGRWHGILIGEGSASNWLLNVMEHVRCVCHDLPLASHVTCTRLDVQVSAPDNYTHFRVLKDAIANPLFEWNRRGRKPKVSLIEGHKTDRGLGHTIYVGSSKTKHGYFMRIYEKPGPHNVRHLRFEVQFKGKVAQAQFENCVGDGDILFRDIVGTVFNTLPDDIKDTHLAHIRDALANSKGVVLRPKGDISTYHSPELAKQIKRALWFKYDVGKALMQTDDDVVCDWLAVELIKCAFVLRNRARRDRYLKRRSEEIGYLKESDAILAQQDATEAAILAGSERPEGPLEGLPEQENLFSPDEWERLLDTAYMTPETWYY
jgi:hypothetical protein